MGERLKRKQVQNFRHRYSESFDRMQVPNLISQSKPDVLTREYRCAAEGSVPAPGVGTNLVLYGEGDRIAALNGNTVVGRITDSANDDIRVALSLSSGMLRCRVTHTSSISKAFTVRLEPTP